MQIYVVKPGDTLFSIGRALGLAPGFLARYNGLQEPYRLAVGQSLLVLYPEQTVTVQPGDTLTSIAASAGTDVASLYRMNPNLSGSDRIYPGQILVTQLEQAARRPAVVSGYAYPNVSERVLRGILPYAGALAPFTYGFTPEGVLVPMDDERLLALAGACGVQPLLHLSTLTAAGAFSAAQAAALLRDPALQQTLAANVLQTMLEKGYEGLDVDFEYLGRDLAEPYAAFIQLLRDTLAPYGLPLITALAPKTSAAQPGTLYEGHNYASLSTASDAVLLMTYEWLMFAHMGFEFSCFSLKIDFYRRKNKRSFAGKSDMRICVLMCVTQVAAAQDSTFCSWIIFANSHSFSYSSAKRK